MCVNVQSRSFIWSRDSRSLLLWSDVRVGNFISRHIAGFGEVGTYIYRYFVYMSSPNSNIPDGKEGRDIESENGRGQSRGSISNHNQR